MICYFANCTTTSLNVWLYREFLYTSVNSLVLCLFLVVYLTCTMALGTISVCLTVLTLNLHHRDPERSVPRWAKVLVLNYLSKILCVRPRKPKTMAERVLRENTEAENRKSIRGGIRRLTRDMHILKPMLHTNNVDSNDTSNYTIGEHVFPVVNGGHTTEVWSDWRELAHVLDRLFFWIVFIFMTASTMIIPTVPLYKEAKSRWHVTGSTEM